MTEDTIKHENAMSSFKLGRNSRGYNWEIKIYSDDLEEMKNKINEMNNWAMAEYGGGEID